MTGDWTSAIAAAEDEISMRRSTPRSAVTSESARVISPSVTSTPGRPDSAAGQTGGAGDQDLAEIGHGLGILRRSR